MIPASRETSIVFYTRQLHNGGVDRVGRNDGAVGISGSAKPLGRTVAMARGWW